MTATDSTAPAPPAPPASQVAQVAPAPDPAALAQRLEALRDEMRDRHRASQAVFATVHPAHRRSAQNLLDYLTLRTHDIRSLQAALAELGVSSLGRAEEHVLRSVEHAIDVLHALDGTGVGHRTESAVGFGEGRRTLEANAAALLGPRPAGRGTRIMVTMPTEAAWDRALVADLLDRGMDCARINCAHDGPEHWVSMVDNIRGALVGAGRRCTILVDLPGPKLRTGPVAPGPEVVRLRPRRDARGLAVAPARAVLVPAGPDRPPLRSDGVPVLAVAADWLATLNAGDTVTTHDTRGSPRVLEVTAATPTSAWVALWDTAYIEAGSTLSAPSGPTVVGPLPAVQDALRVRRGDLVTLTADLSPAPAGDGSAIEPGRGPWRIGCTLPEALGSARAGERVWFDDGKIGGVVRATRPGEIDVEITVAGPDGTNLKGGRGINLPDTDLDLSALRPEDEPALRFAAGHADVVGLSFAQRPGDVTELHRRLCGLGRIDAGLVLKIETAAGFGRLPELLVAGMGWERLGVMVARGDLAVECGFERLAEVQEEILWLCDAAHVPVVWATQVLDQMARTGQPSRAEVSDAVMAARAECVMLNKGPHIAEAVAALDDILRRMDSHQDKKVPLLRRLASWSPDRAAPGGERRPRT